MATLKHRQTVKLADTNVLKRKDITRELLLMWISRPEGFAFKAGQYCTIGSGGIERAYSISSAPHEQDIELFVELVPPPDGNGQFCGCPLKGCRIVIPSLSGPTDEVLCRI